MNLSSRSAVLRFKLRALADLKYLKSEICNLTFQRLAATSLFLLLLGLFQIAAAFAASAPAKDADADWSLAGREGACVSLDLLKKKYPEFGDVKSPYQLAEKLKAQGHNAEVKEYTLGKRPSVEVRVPDKNLYVMFIRTDLCGKR